MWLDRIAAEICRWWAGVKSPEARAQAKKEARDRQQRAAALAAEMARLDQLEVEAKRLHRPTTSIYRQKRALRTQMLQEGL